MANRIGDDETAFNTIPEIYAQPRAHIYDEFVGRHDDSEGAAVHQAVVYQTITGKQLDNSTGYSGNPQIHDGTTGALIPWPMSYGSLADDTAGNNADENQASGQQPTILAAQLAGSSNPERVVWRWPVFVPDGHNYMVLYVDADPELLAFHPHIKKYTVGASPTALTLEEPYATQGEVTADGLIMFRLYFATDSAKYVLSLDCDFGGVSANENGEPRLRGYMMVPELHKQSTRGTPPIEITNPTGNITPIRGTSFNPIWDTLIIEDGPLSSYVTNKLAANDGYLHELVTGAGVAGRSRLIDGHNHDGTTTGGNTIDIPLLSTCLGWPTEDSAAGFTTSQALYGRAPTISSTDDDGGGGATSWYVLSSEIIQCPARTGSPSFNWAALLYVATTKTDTFDVRVRTSTDYSSWAASATQTTNTSVGWQYLSGTKTYSSSSTLFVTCEVRGTGTIDATTYASLCGWSIWVT